MKMLSQPWSFIILARGSWRQEEHESGAAWAVDQEPASPKQRPRPGTTDRICKPALDTRGRLQVQGQPGLQGLKQV